MTPLRDHLLDAYGGFADRRFKDRNLDRAIKVDDKNGLDICPGFCTIFVAVPDRNGDALFLTLHKAPCNPEITSLVVKRGGRITYPPGGPTIILNLTSNQIGTIASLATAIRRIVGRGRHYDDPNLKWICPRTADSLDRLVQVLAVYRANHGSEDESRSPDPIRARRRWAFVRSRPVRSARPGQKAPTQQHPITPDGPDTPE